MEPMTLDKLVPLVLQWAQDRNLLDNSDATRQMLKAVAEVGELADEVLKGNKDNQRLEMGDVLVTLILTSYKLDLTLDECLEAAYNKIYARKGKVVNGIFVKEAS